MTLRCARILDSIAQIDAASWNSLLRDGQPFLRHEFLLALEESRCAVPRTGWTARHLVLDDAQGRPIGAMPLYRKSHSRGEFVFDFSWASAYAQHGLPYYPKLLCAVPFTPVRGPRLLVRPGADPKLMNHTLIKAAIDYARGERLSSWHVLFPTDDTAERLKSAGLILRRDCQFHWYNDMDDARWDAVYPFYADTFYRHGHEPYLNLDFFKRLAASMPDRIMLKVARIGRTPIAVAIFFVGSDALFGRYWGAGGNYHSLHFETCYYQGIEYCIDKKLQRFEPGTQGEHKVPRGFVPTLMSSAHFVADPRFAAAIRDFAAREARGVDSYAAAVNEHVPYHRAPDEELQL